MTSTHGSPRVRRGLGHVRADRELRLLLTAQATALVFFACVVPIEVVYAKETLDAGDAGFGALLSAWGVGIVAGSMVFALARKMSMLALIAISTLAIATSYLGQAVAPSLLVACAFAVVGGVGNGVQGVAVLTAVQLRTPKALQARVAGLLESLGAAMPGAGFILGGLLTAAFDPRWRSRPRASRSRSWWRAARSRWGGPAAARPPPQATAGRRRTPRYPSRPRRRPAAPSAVVARRRPLSLDLDDDRQHHRPPAQTLRR